MGKKRFLLGTIRKGASIEETFEEEDLPRRFSYSELSIATQNFSSGSKFLGFSETYKGNLRNPQRMAVIKRISGGDKRSNIREYNTEAKILSRLSHPNVAKLLGWCHDKADDGKFFVVLEYVPNGFLRDYVCFMKPLPWPARYKIAKGVASALFHLHEEQENSIYCGDILVPNHVMVDADFNPKLANFRKAVLLDDKSSDLVDGEWKIESKSNELFQFGVLALIIACGTNVHDWHKLLDLYERGALREAADNSLDGEFIGEEMERLITIGMWCCQLDLRLRPTIGQVVSVLNFTAPLPRLDLWTLQGEALPQFCRTVGAGLARYRMEITRRGLALSHVSLDASS